VTPGTSTFWAYGSGMGPGGNLTGVRTARLKSKRRLTGIRGVPQIGYGHGPNLSGTIMFEIDSAQWGSGPNGTATSTGGWREANGVVTGSTDRTALKSKTSTSISAYPISESPYQLQ